jgi:muramoyltetrapeptide carboxypeptidase
MPSPSLRIIRASSREQNDLLQPRLAELRAAGFSVLYDDLPADPTWPYAAAAAPLRARAIADALREPGTSAVLCARGGYGASDTLPLLPWDELARLPPKLLVGFSDVSALHSALYTRLGWQTLHAPMPATALWGKDGEAGDVSATPAVVAAQAAGRPIAGELPVSLVTPAGSSGARAADQRPISGRLFGGCFTVLTNLIGTPYLPQSLRDHVIFIEDTDEHPARLMRAWNQWLQAGLLDGARALVIGYLRGLGDKIPDCAPFVYEEFARRSPVPVFSTPAFGHTSPNYPLAIGADATIAGGHLRWQCRQAASGDLA